MITEEAKTLIDTHSQSLLSINKGDLELLHPPPIYNIVEEGIYRSQQFEKAHFPFIKQLKLKSVLYLSHEIPTGDILSFLEQNNIDFFNLGLKCWRPTIDWRSVSEELIKEGLEYILNTNNHPVLIMCSTGRYETGCLVGCLRRLQHINISHIIAEYRQHAGFKNRYSNEQLFELFDIDLVTVTNPPSWFIAHENMFHILQKEKYELENLKKKDPTRYNKLPAYKRDGLNPVQSPLISPDIKISSKSCIYEDLD